MDEKVSVIVATYRRERALEKALSSLVAQIYKNIEIIVVDDNGEREWNEKVAKIVYGFKNQYSEVCFKLIVNSPNLGSARARNVGIEASTGMYVTFLDDDDVYLPNKIQEQLGDMKKKNADYSITDLKLYYANEKLSEHRTRSYIQDIDYNSMLKYHLMHHLTGTDTMMFRKSYLQQIGGFDPIDVGDEFYLMLKAIEGKGKFSYLNTCNVRAYVHTGEGGLSSGEGKINGENCLYEFKKKYFHLLSKKEIKYIKARHYAVIAFAELRQKRYAFFVRNAFMAFSVSPQDCFSILFGR